MAEAEIEAENKAKAVTDIDGEEFKFQLRKELRTLKKIIEEEDKLLAFYQQEREKINYNWIISKKELDDKKSELINKEREIQDLKENHFMTLNLYKQKYVSRKKDQTLAFPEPGPAIGPEEGCGSHFKAIRGRPPTQGKGVQD